MVGVNGEVYVRQAYEAILHGDFELALQGFQQAIAAEPDNADYYYKGSVTCARSSKLPLALQYAQKAVELKPDDHTYRLHLNTLKARQLTVDVRTKLQAASPNVEGCIDELKEAIRLDPLSSQAFLLLGFAYRMRKDYRRSLEALKEVLTLEPMHEEAARWLKLVRSERRKLVKQQYSNSKSKRNR
jgi:tetratricopeptide (TPR) repeat protein